MDTASAKLLSISCNPTQAQTGRPFTLTVTIDSIQATDVQVTLEKQRLVFMGGAVQATPIVGNGYFIPNFGPKAILIPAGSVTGTSDPIKINLNATVGNPPGTPVTFPDYVIFTAFINAAQNDFVPIMVTIEKSPLVAARDSKR